MKPTDFSYRLSNYLSKYLPGVSGLRPNTITSYRDVFIALIQFFEDSLGIKAEKITLETFNADNVIKYLDWLEDVRGNAISTRNNRLAAIHAFAKYVERRSPEKCTLCRRSSPSPAKKGQPEHQNICRLRRSNCCSRFLTKQPRWDGGIAFF